MQDHTFTLIVSAVGIGGALGGIVIGHSLARSAQQKQWLLDRRKEEFRELMNALTEAFLAIVLKVQKIKDGGLTPKEGEEEREKHGKALIVLKNRIYIAEDVQQRGLYDEWTNWLKVVWDTGDFTKFEDNFEKMREWIIEAAMNDSIKRR